MGTPGTFWKPQADADVYSHDPSYLPLLHQLFTIPRIRSCDDCSRAAIYGKTGERLLTPLQWEGSYRLASLTARCLQLGRERDRLGQRTSRCKYHDGGEVPEFRVTL